MCFFVHLDDALLDPVLTVLDVVVCHLLLIDHIVLSWLDRIEDQSYPAFQVFVDRNQLVEVLYFDLATFVSGLVPFVSAVLLSVYFHLAPVVLGDLVLSLFAAVSGTPH